MRRITSFLIAFVSPFRYGAGILKPNYWFPLVYVILALACVSPFSRWHI